MANADDLEALRPGRRERIMDLVQLAGINVALWTIRRDGSPVEDPPKNPKYCYDWAFGGNGEPTALCVWHRSLALSDGEIVYEGNLRADALALARAAEDRFRPDAEKNRARSQANRAQEFDRLLQRAFRSGQAVRVITLLGEQRGGDEPGLDVSKVERRRLDPESWSVVTYGDDGRFRLVRGFKPPVIVEAAPQVVAQTVFVDQFSVPEPAKPQAVNGSAYPRSAEVRSVVLRRAAGVCECCGAAGFQMASGAVYLETHHVVALSENGLDVEWNVVALCPNDHRRAHYAVEREELRRWFVAHLIAKVPAAESALAAMVSSRAMSVE